MQTLAFDSSESPTLPCSLADRLEPWSDTESMAPVESVRRPSARFFETAGATHPGRVRAVNEDAYAIFPEAGFCAVADGLGGRRAGDVASRTAIHEARQFLAGARSTAADAADLLVSAIGHANGVVHAVSKGRDLRTRGMATTFVGLLFAGPVVAIAHVGDSRAYRVRRGAVERLTADHSMREVYLQMYGHRADPAVAERNASIVTRALGARANVEVDVRVEVLEPGDAFLLCSDGLWGLVSDEEIGFAIASSPSLEGALATLIATAYNRGGPDNITGVIARPRIAHPA